MIAKCLFLVLLGAALILASPVPAEEDVPNGAAEDKQDSEVENHLLVFYVSLTIFFALMLKHNSVERVIIDDADDELQWNLLKHEWDMLIQKGMNKKVSKRTRVGDRNEDTNKDEKKDDNKELEKKWEELREKGEKSLDEINKTYQKIKAQGKEIAADAKNLFKTAKEAWIKIKKTGKEAFEDVKELYGHLKKAGKKFKKFFG
ncbi:hypothetical protein TSAR_003647 [Trichomalopsis sarcophagae]|uniref:SXP/RAL-2 family protein Ani s 5-like cation-binding domain-containing protein n=1 Tax=Trichomalopsis sarcophagae TaxID=543379 RepID=A0A232FCV2_9HYME|nr:hypothetical protein TSAR_003647 [Trichomalopsis sarcophagae]